jgi:hypothetical protein
MLSKMFGELPPRATAAKRSRDEAGGASAAAAAPLRRSGRERKAVSYAPVRVLPLSGLILAAFAELGDKAKEGLTWPTLAALIRPNFEDGDPRIEGLFQSTRTAVQGLLRQGKLRRSLVSTEDGQEAALDLPLGHHDRTLAALRAMVVQAAQVPAQAMGRWDVPTPTPEEAAKQEVRPSVAFVHPPTQPVSQSAARYRWGHTAAARPPHWDATQEARLREEAEAVRRALEQERALREEGASLELQIQQGVVDAQAEARSAAAGESEASERPWLPAPALLPELGGGGEGGAAPADGDGAAGGSDDDDWEQPVAAADAVREQVDVTPGCRVELVLSLASIRNRLARQSDTAFFGCPPGWTQVRPHPPPPPTARAPAVCVW